MDKVLGPQLAEILSVQEKLDAEYDNLLEARERDPTGNRLVVSMALVVQYNLVSRNLVSRNTVSTYTISVPFKAFSIQIILVNKNSG